MDFDACSEITKHKIVQVSENKMKFVIKNNIETSIRKVIVDGCLINDHRQRCDYLFEINDAFNYVIYVELKGCDIEKAFEQLDSTVNICRTRHSSAKTKTCYIVASRVPKIGTKIQNLKKKFIAKNLIQVQIHTNYAEHVLNNQLN